MPHVAVWPRGGAKSSTIELAIAYLAKKLTRRFVLYVSSTQAQANNHVQSVSRLLEAQGIDRALGKYGHSTGWRQDRLQTAQGFAVSAYGLDGAMRGIKIEDFRPDLIVFDDIDDHSDTPKTIEKKIAAITTSILPAGSIDATAVFVQNLIHEDGIVAQLVDGRADFLYDREVPSIVVAVQGLKVENIPLESGRMGYRIVEGTPTWSGQSIEICEAQINDWGLAAFMREAQHDLETAQGYFFDHKAFRVVSGSELPEFVCVARSWDLAATEGDGDYTVGVLMGVTKNRKYYVIDLVRGQMSSERVEKAIFDTAISDLARYPGVIITTPQDPGQAGVAQKNRFKLKFRELGLNDENCQLISKPVTGKKATRATGWATHVNSGNTHLVAADWNRAYIQEHRRFREDEEHLFDDQVDASADACNVISLRTKTAMALY